MLGSGKNGDPYRVALPTYSHIHGNITQGFALVLIPEDVHGLTDLKHEAVEQTTEGDFYPSLCDKCIAKMHDNLDERYQEHRGEFRVELA